MELELDMVLNLFFSATLGFAGRLDYRAFSTISAKN